MEDDGGGAEGGGGNFDDGYGEEELEEEEEEEAAAPSGTSSASKSGKSADKTSARRPGRLTPAPQPLPARQEEQGPLHQLPLDVDGVAGPEGEEAREEGGAA